MNSQATEEEKITFVLKRSTRNIWIAKFIILLASTAIFSSIFLEASLINYKKGQELTKEEYIANYEQYKNSLLASKTYTNAPLSTLAVFIMFAFLLGSYELTALIIGFIIGKLITPKKS